MLALKITIIIIYYQKEKGRELFLYQDQQQIQIKTYPGHHWIEGWGWGGSGGWETQKCSKCQDFTEVIRNFVLKIL